MAPPTREDRPDPSRLSDNIHNNDQNAQIIAQNAQVLATLSQTKALLAKLGGTAKFDLSTIAAY